MQIIKIRLISWFCLFFNCFMSYYTQKNIFYFTKIKHLRQKVFPIHGAENMAFQSLCKISENCSYHFDKSLPFSILLFPLHTGFYFFEFLAFSFYHSYSTRYQLQIVHLCQLNSNSRPDDNESKVLRIEKDNQILD